MLDVTKQAFEVGFNTVSLGAALGLLLLTLAIAARRKRVLAGLV